MGTIIVICTFLFITTVSTAGIVTDYLNKQSKYRIEAMKQEVKLEKLRQESFLVETEKLRLEIEKTRQQLALDTTKQPLLQEKQ
ncbi:hypothetical protein ACH0B5_01610 [Ureibacillus sp. 179-F W5.1 NHS]|uniref:Uncharacterized protein n=1 Tax=Lysinibacillus halotolerans TaxID=1368476 RepID=A0A3M8HEF6_9BACI|nr:hypothetical protein [Lysinibacillus halotolerans]RND00750.1 hypothetical protein EC501_03480 [Lysinibacillus halotolerans]